PIEIVVSENKVRRSVHRELSSPIASSAAGAVAPPTTKPSVSGGVVDTESSASACPPQRAAKTAAAVNSLIPNAIPPGQGRTRCAYNILYGDGLAQDERTPARKTLIQFSPCERAARHLGRFPVNGCWAMGLWHYSVNQIRINQVSCEGRVPP